MNVLKWLITAPVRPIADTACTLAMHGAEKRSREWIERRNAKTRQLRDECKLPPHAAFN